jgi:hypothetical protein
MHLTAVGIMRQFMAQSERANDFAGKLDCAIGYLGEIFFD